MAKLKIAHNTSIDQGQASGFGGTGGQHQAITSTGVKTINVQYDDDNGNAVANGYIIAQKGSRKYQVANAAAVGTQVTTVVLTNTDSGNLTAGQGSVVCYNTSNVAFYASRITTKHVYDFDGNKYIYKINTVATADYANVAVR